MTEREQIAQWKELFNESQVMIAELRAKSAADSIQLSDQDIGNALRVFSTPDSSAGSRERMCAAIMAAVVRPDRPVFGPMKLPGSLMAAMTTTTAW